MTLRALGIGKRSALVFSVLGTLMLVMGIISLIQTHAMNVENEEIRGNWLVGVMATGEIGNNIGRSRALTLRSILASDQESRENNRSIIEQLAKNIVAALDKYETSIHAQEDRDLFNAFNKELSRYLGIQERIFEYLRADNINEAIRVSKVEMGPSADAMMVELNKLAKFNAYGATTAADASDAAYDNAVTVITISLIMILLVMVFASWALTRSIVNPLDEAVQLAKRISEKDLTQQIHPKGKDEPAQLLESLMRMQNSLRSTIQQIASSSEQLASASEELHAVTEDTTRGLHQQSAEIEQAATAVNEMTVAVEEVATNAVNTADASKEADATTQLGREKVESALESIQGLVHDVEETSTQISLLATRANEINRVLDVIGSIAQQTNLLALNAAIEAARAGEAGRGFAVVADEVRALAHRTQQSTAEIEEMITGIHQGTDSAVNAMEASQNRANSTLQVAMAAGDALGVISHSISTINERNLVIASASEEQAQVAREVDRNLTNIRDLATQTSAGADQTSAASQELSRLAINLNGMIASFKL